MGSALALSHRRSIRPRPRPSGTRSAHRRLAAFPLRLARPASHRTHHRTTQTKILVATFHRVPQVSALHLGFSDSVLTSSLPVPSSASYLCGTTAAPLAACIQAESSSSSLICLSTPALHPFCPASSKTMHSYRR